MKKLLGILLSLVLLTGCTAAPAPTTGPAAGEVLIQLSDGGVTFEGEGVHTANDIVYYESGHDEGYGEGEDWETHTAEDAAAHTVVHITKPGIYRLTGKLSAGQIAVDLGENAKDDPDASVILVLDGADITCRVAPAIIFYNVYESGVANGLAGANILLAGGSENRVVGSHVAEIYEPGTEDKLHKYDGAVYSRMSMKLDGSGRLRIEADNEGLCSELHLTIDGGEIYIESGNDGINTNEDNVSVTTINDGKLHIVVAGTTGEGDGIDSNGSIVINGGHVECYACAVSGDSGLDADLGVTLNGGTVITTGNMLDRIEGSQTFAAFSFAEAQEGLTYTLKDSYGSPVLECQTPSTFTQLLLSSPELSGGTYTLWSGDTQFEGVAGMGGGHFGGAQIIERPDWPDKGDGDVEIPPQPTNPIVIHGNGQPPEGERPADMPVPPMTGDPGQMPVPDMSERGESMPIPELPEGVTPPADGFGRQPGDLVVIGIRSTDFPIAAGANYFTDLRAVS